MHYKYKRENLFVLTKKKLISFGLILFLSLNALAQENKFMAIGPEKAVVKYLDKPGWPVPRELSKVAIEVHFDLIPTKMRFSMPCYPSMVTENNIHFSNGWTETYDPKASSSCEILWDRNARYSRMWIESQNPARIIVRWRSAICDPDGYISHILIFQVARHMAKAIGQMSGITSIRMERILDMYGSILVWLHKALQ